MGYTTDFEGSFQIVDKLGNPYALATQHRLYLEAFSESRRMKRDASIATDMDDNLRVMVDLPIGHEGAYYVGSATDGMSGQGRDLSILDYNNPPFEQPGLWCKWAPNQDGTAIEWNGVEKFYDYIEWLRYLVKHFLSTWGYRLKGEVKWFGEDRGDTGTIYADGLEITTSEDKREEVEIATVGDLIKALKGREEDPISFWDCEDDNRCGQSLILELGADSVYLKAQY